MRLPLRAGRRALVAVGARPRDGPARRVGRRGAGELVLSGPARTRTSRSSTRGVGRRRRLRGVHPQLRPARELRPGPRAGARVRRVVDPVDRRQDLDVQDPAGHEVVGRRAGDLGGRALTRTSSSSTAAHPNAATSARATSSGYLTDAGVEGGHRAGPADPRRRRPTFANTLLLQAYVPILPKHIWSKYIPRADRRPEGEGLLQERAAGRRHRALPGRRVEARRFHPVRPQPELLGQAGRGRRGDPPALRQRRHDGPGPQERRDRLRPRRARRPVQRPEDRAEHRRPSRASPTATPS